MKNRRAEKARRRALYQDPEPDQNPVKYTPRVLIFTLFNKARFYRYKYRTTKNPDWFALLKIESQSIRRIKKVYGPKANRLP